MAYVHTSVNQASEKYQRNEKRYSYTTPKSFLQQITLYRNLLERSQAQLQHKMNRLNSGLQKLQTTAAQVNSFIYYCRHKYLGSTVQGCGGKIKRSVNLFVDFCLTFGCLMYSLWISIISALGGGTTSQAGITGS